MLDYYKFADENKLLKWNFQKEVNNYTIYLKIISCINAIFDAVTRALDYRAGYAVRLCQHTPILPQLLLISLSVLIYSIC